MKTNGSRRKQYGEMVTSLLSLHHIVFQPCTWLDTFNFFTFQSNMSSLHLNSLTCFFIKKKMNKWINEFHSVLHDLKQKAFWQIYDLNFLLTTGKSLRSKRVRKIDLRWGLERSKLNSQNINPLEIF